MGRRFDVPSSTPKVTRSPRLVTQAALTADDAGRYVAAVYAPVAQWIEQLPSKQWVARSSRVGGATPPLVIGEGFGQSVCNYNLANTAMFVPNEALLTRCGNGAWSKRCCSGSLGWLLPPGFHVGPSFTWRSSASRKLSNSTSIFVCVRLRDLRAKEEDLGGVVGPEENKDH